MIKVAILISGSGTNMEALVRAMTGDFPARPLAVISNKPEAGGLAKAKALGVPTHVIDHRGRPREEFDAELAQTLTDLAPDLVLHAGFMRILSPTFFEGYKGPMLNIHPSLLPKYPGLNTFARAIEAGDAEAGCTIHEVIPELDAGPILGQARVPILPDDTPDSLAKRVQSREYELYPLVLRRYAEGLRERIDI
ncbi:MAG: phosphoribosylglycinamide formyltransferase [Rhodobacterales bacterium]|nr:MAG: phosphoribosylglycinamide formyltransferase [Rhodobacterales bacterium]